MASSDDHIVTTTEETRRDRHTSPAFGTAAVASLLPSQRSSLHRDVNGSKFIVLMSVFCYARVQGVSGTGKSTLGGALSKALHLPFIDGDDLHPVANVAKMSRGEPLEDADRRPWLETIRKTAVARVLDQVGVEYKERPGVQWVGKSRTNLDGGYESSMIFRAEKRRADGAWRPGVIVACSALKKTYRAVLRGEMSSLQSGPGSTLDAMSLPTYFVYLKGDREVLMARMANRTGHFMKAGMLESQLNTLESPEDEAGVVTVSVEMSTEEQVRRVVDMFRSLGR